MYKCAHLCPCVSHLYVPVICMCVYGFLCVCVCVYVMFMSVCLLTCVYISVVVHMCVHINVYIYVSICECDVFTKVYTGECT